MPRFHRCPDCGDACDCACLEPASECHHDCEPDAEGLRRQPGADDDPIPDYVLDER